MDAKTVWQTWRKILRDETLQQHLLTQQWPQPCDHFTSAEQEVITAYAHNIDRAKWFIENYQFRLVNSFINALETGAPLTLRALMNCGMDISELSREFLRAYDWHDYGPRVYSYCKDVLGWLISSQERLGLSDALKDLMGLESQVVALYLSLATNSKPILARKEGYAQSGMARLYYSRFRLSQWLRDKKSLGLTMPLTGEESLLVVMPDRHSRHKYLLLPPRSAQIYQDAAGAGYQPGADDLPHLDRLITANALVFRETVNEMC